MKKAVTLFCLLAMFVMVSCASDTEPEPEVVDSELTLADRAGVYANTLNTIIFVLRTDGKGTGMVVTAAPAPASTTTQLIVGSHESTETNFKATTTTLPPVFKATIIFYADDPSKAKYTFNANGSGGTELTKVEF